MSGLEWNKIAASILLAGLIAMIVGTVSDALYHDNVPAEKRGFEVEGVEEASATDGAAAVAAGPVDILPYLGAADATAGEAIAKRCTTCHTFEKGGANKVGPNLWSVLGGPKVHMASFAYSDALIAMKGKSWGFQEISEFLENPKKYAPGTKMAFAGIKKPEERANLIAYLNKMNDHPLAIPKVAPVTATPAATTAVPAPVPTTPEAIRPDPAATKTP